MGTALAVATTVCAAAGCFAGEWWKRLVLCWSGTLVGCVLAYSSGIGYMHYPWQVALWCATVGGGFLLLCLYSRRIGVAVALFGTSYLWWSLMAPVSPQSRWLCLFVALLALRIGWLQRIGVSAAASTLAVLGVFEVLAPLHRHTFFFALPDIGVYLYRFLFCCMVGITAVSTVYGAVRDKKIAYTEAEGCMKVFGNGNNTMGSSTEPSTPLEQRMSDKGGETE